MKTILVSFLLTSLLAMSVQGPSKVFKVVHWKDEPAEIVSVKLRGLPLKTGESLAAYPDWTKDLEITIKNVSDKPITFLSVFLLTKNDSGSDAVATTFYSFGSLPGGDGVVQYLKPNETALLTHQFTNGDVLDPRPAEISFENVFWNNNKAIQWRTGMIMQLVGDDGRYIPKPKTEGPR